MKECLKCKTKKPIECFGKDKTKKDGLNIYCKECINIRTRKWVSENKEKRKDIYTKWYQNNKEQHKNACNNWRFNNREKSNAINRAWRSRNKDYTSKRYHSDINFRIKRMLSSRLLWELKSEKKYKKTISFLGCSIEYFKNYIASKFKPGMNWDNFGQWHLDHVKPCINFDLINKEEQKECFNFKNYQPLWKIDNLKKHSKIVEEVI